MTAYRWRRVAAAVGLGLAATTFVSGVNPTTAQAQTKIKGFPAITVTNVVTGKAVKLSTLNTGKLPTLAWFWAPH
jgi:hypothetical protein